MSVRCACSCKSCVRSSPARRRRSLLSPPAAESPPALPRSPRNGDCTACARCLLLESPGPESRESCAPTECGGPSAPAEANPPRPRGGVRLTLQGRAQWEDETHLDEVLPSRTGPAAVAVRLEGGRQRREGEDGPSARSTQGRASRVGAGAVEAVVLEARSDQLWCSTRATRESRLRTRRGETSPFDCSRSTTIENFAREERP